MKKIIALLLVIVLLLSFYVCSEFDIISKIKNFDIVALLNNEPDWNTIVVKELKVGSPTKYYFKQLSSKEKKAYNNVLSEIDAFPKAIEIPSLNQDELSTVFEALLYDNPYLFFLGRSCTTTNRGLKSYFNAEYTMSALKYNKMKQALLKKSAEIMAKLGQKSQFETELFIHDYIVNNCSYSNTNEDESTAYGALIGKKAACEGYSKAAKVLLDMAGIECYVVSGMSNNFQGHEEDHMWNIVKINNQYYHLDLTWDDPITINQSEKNDPRYTYFNITDKDISKTHSDFSTKNACMAKTDNYFVKKGLYFTEYNAETRSKIAKALAAAANNGKGSFELELKFGSPEVYAQAFKWFFDKNQVYDILVVADRFTGKNLSNPTVSYIQNENFNIIELIVDY
ncbi:MAG: transglutaminase domain-containing protein [Eubacteriales bacterium]